MMQWAMYWMMEWTSKRMQCMHVDMWVWVGMCICMGMGMGIHGAEGVPHTGVVHRRMMPVPVWRMDVGVRQRKWRRRRERNWTRVAVLIGLGGLLDTGCDRAWRLLRRR